MQWLMYVAVLAAATGVCAVLVPLFRRLALRLDFVDRPLHQAHKRHGHEVPLLGGLAMLCAWLLIVAAGVGVALWQPGWLPGSWAATFRGAPTVLGRVAVIAGGAIFLAFMGMWDDRRPFPPGVKLIAQLLVAGAVACYHDFQVSIFFEHPLMVWLITVGWFVFILNAFNFFDNMDGLAAGVALVGSVLFMVVAAIRGQDFVASLGAATAGIALGFYLYNRAPASIFMGDSGSHLLGFLLAVQAALTNFYTEATPTVAPVFIPLLVLALPIFDTFAVIVIRLRQGRPIYKGDHNHISHRFVRMGLSKPVAVLVVHLLALALGLGALPLLTVSPGYAVVILLQAGVILAIVCILHGLGPVADSPGNKTGEKMEAREPTPRH